MKQTTAALAVMGQQITDLQASKQVSALERGAVPEDKLHEEQCLMLKKDGQCKERFVKENCEKSCGPEAKDKLHEEHCLMLKMDGKCKERFVKENCEKSCGPEAKDKWHEYKCLMLKKDGQCA